MRAPLRNLVLFPKTGISYFLRATFNRADIALNAGDLETQAPGSVQDGTLTLVETDGTLEIESNKIKLTPQISPVVGDLGFYSQSVVRALGRGLKATLNLTDFVTNAGVLMWVDSADADYNASAGVRHGLFFNSTTAFFLMASNAGALQIATQTTWAGSTDYTFAVILGGFDSTGLPYYAGQAKANYKYGFWLLVMGGAYAAWTVLWIDTRTNTTPMYAAVSNHSGEFTTDDMEVPDVDLSSAQVPVAFSSFTGSNGTSLDAITPEVGPAWVDQSGDWDIQSNRAACNGAGLSTTNDGVANGLFRGVVGTGTDDNPARVVRFTDTNNYWYLQADQVNNLIELHEVNAGTDTVRASTAKTFNASTDYTLLAIADGTTISGFTDNGSRISYASATLNQTAARHGIRAETANGRFDNVVSYARTSAAYNVLDTV